MKDTSVKLKEASKTDHQRGVDVSVFMGFLFLLLLLVFEFEWFVFVSCVCVSKGRRLWMLSLQRTFNLY